MDNRKETAEKIIAVLTNRSGFNDLWYNLDEEIQTEITDEVVNILPIHNVSCCNKPSEKDVVDTVINSVWIRGVDFEDYRSSFEEPRSSLKENLDKLYYS